jgi:hypothetical protein
MASIPIGALTSTRVRAQSVVSIEANGQGIIRYGLAAVILWIGAMKFTAYFTRTWARRRTPGWKHSALPIGRTRRLLRSSSCSPVACMAR